MVFVYKKLAQFAVRGVLCLPGDQSHLFVQPTINPFACCIWWARLLGRAVFPPWNEGLNFGSYSAKEQGIQYASNSSNSFLSTVLKGFKGSNGRSKAERSGNYSLLGFEETNHHMAGNGGSFKFLTHQSPDCKKLNSANS